MPIASASSIRAAGALLSALALAGCAARDLWPVERLDPESAVNFTIMADPWIYSHDVPMLAANARDYLNVGVIESNRAGTRAYWLGVVAWSTIDRSSLADAAPLGKPGKLKLAWPGQSLELRPVAGGLAEIGAHETIFAAPQPVHEDAWYALTEAQFALIAKSPPTSLSLLPENGVAIVHVPWHVEPRAMEQFLEATGFTIGVR